MRDTGVSQKRQSADVVLGDDWIAPATSVEQEMQAKRARRGFFSLRGSPLTRKIITFNLIAITLLVAGVLYLNASRNSLAYQSAVALVSEATLVADVFEAQIPGSGSVNLATSDGIDAAQTLSQIDLRAGLEVLVFDAQGSMVTHSQGSSQVRDVVQPGATSGTTVFSDALGKVWSLIDGVFGQSDRSPRASLETQVAELATRTLDGGQVIQSVFELPDGKVFAASAPILKGGELFGVVALATPTGEIEALVRAGREQVLQLFVVALLVSVGLSLVLASTIANPLADLAEAAELGRDRNARKVKSGRVRIPDLSARPDEIGRLSRALRGMVKALYNRIDGNEQFAADVAHEIKNPLASLQSAVGTLRMVKRDDQREKLLEVIEHDVRRLDRLVSDISNASRLDAELVKEEEEEFDLLNMLGNLNQYLGEDARAKGIDYITDLPPQPILLHGLEARLAQVFVNLITNAISFCEDGDAIRVWARRRDNRVLVVVEDTGPGIPEQALTKVFKRFYSQRPDEHFGNNSGLGLAISKQIVEAHGGVIWAENIRPTEADMTSDPLGARFVVGLPV
ncbi:HAMP domain-containing protein [Epibacterium sp. SM1979]|uniref:histidine kinase n=1 Tax=Tritonibacter litoralis TaxID=2662264 RepID=A0A843YGW7_9RHOB|nr:sensor histidine kinase [Tritonibacter litoralis]MQQ08684.1 HAMP domain-containing protein [Tritonibacter litoralis]